MYTQKEMTPGMKIPWVQAAGHEYDNDFRFSSLESPFAPSVVALRGMEGIVSFIMGLILFLTLPVAFFASWAGLVYCSRLYFPPMQDKRIGLLIAHCDDEAMFFSPTVIALAKPELRNHVQILCLSQGLSRLPLTVSFTS
jgi:hypothetical protein